MRQVEIHIVSGSHDCFDFLDRKATLSKYLFNAAMRYVSEKYESEGRYCNYYEVNRAFVDSNQSDYRALSANVAQQVLMQVDRCWKSYFAAIKEYAKTPAKFNAPPMPPKSKEKEWHRNMLTYTRNVIGAAPLREGKLVLNSEDTMFTTRLKSISQVQIIPLPTRQYKIILIYEKESAKKIESAVLAGCDIGVNNLMTIGFNDNKMEPFVIKGGQLKSINQYYNKRKKELRKKLPKLTYGSKKIRAITHKHNMKVNDFIHKASRIVVNKLYENKTSKIVIGYNPEWKQSVCLGRRNNQNFVSIPFLKMINAVAYKCELAGIECVIREESYTSKCSFLDSEKCRKKEHYLGRRVTRGLFVSSNGTVINADLNSAYNILKKEVPDAFSEGIEGVVVHPARIACANRYYKLL